MRKIKFKAWDKQNKVVSEVYALFHNGDVYLGNESTGLRVAHEVELMQYTGLKDKNGTEIYEGDILKDKLIISPEMSSKWYEGEEEIFEVKLPEFFLQLGKKLEHTDEKLEEFVGFMEIIGNIYENPELLK